MAQNMETFDAYFRRADLDRDGRISGAEAVAFFQGSNLPKQTLAQIWMHADQNKIGFLGRAEFYNALKLVTVAQSGRELTPEIVKAALYGPAASKIPAPQIGLAPMTQTNAVMPLAPQMPAPMTPNSSQNLGLRGPQIIQNVGTTQQLFPLTGTQIRPQPAPLAPSLPLQTINHSYPGGSSNIAALKFPNSLVPNTPNRMISPFLAQNGFELAASSVPSSIPPKPQDQNLLLGQQPNKDSRSLSTSGISTQSKQDAVLSGYSSNLEPPVSSVNIPLSASHSSKQKEVGPLSLVSTTPIASAGSSDFSIQSQFSWPRITSSNIEKYTNVFIEVDKDRDGKITGEQACNLFLSWRLPREVLKQVLDLSDQDNDSMLSLKEFCAALYLMERYREGHSLPTVLPSNIGLEEIIFPVADQTRGAYASRTFQPTPGMLQQKIPGTPSAISSATLKPPIQASNPTQTYQSGSDVELKSTSLFADLSPVNNPEKELVPPRSGSSEIEDADKKVVGMESVILDSKEKIELYRTKMQELVLYKSRCDNRLNEITERASSDKREAELLSKKYEEKYKQVGEVASRLTIEEAVFRDIQVRKSELSEAIVKMEQGGSVDGLLQVRADRIQLDLEGLEKALHERCERHGLHVKLATTIKLPFGWEPGIEDGAVVWDEDWDKFEDEGFVTEKEQGIIDANSIDRSKKDESSLWEDQVSLEESPRVTYKGGKFDKMIEIGSTYAHSEDEFGRSPPKSPFERRSLGSPSQESPRAPFEKSTSVYGGSPSAKEDQSESGRAESTLSGDRYFDEPSWSTSFNDDVSSVWGFTASSTKDFEPSRNGHDSFFGSNDFGLIPIRTSSSHGGGDPFKKNAKDTVSIADSIPSSPLFNSTPKSGRGLNEPSFDSFSRFDSFQTHDSNSFFPQPGNLARFDSIGSTMDSDHTRGFSAFDDNDPFGSSDSFKTIENRTPKRGTDNWNAF